MLSFNRITRFLLVFDSTNEIESFSKSSNFNSRMSEILNPAFMPKTTRNPNL
ncbi:hypothetical protein D3C87_2169910 [compost metagenome]